LNILVLDGSGSVGQGGFNKIKATAAKLTASMGPNVNVGALQFGGPKINRDTYPEWGATAEHEAQYRNFWLCFGHPYALKEWGYKDSKPNDVCGQKWETVLSNDTAAVEKTIADAPWLAADMTFTHVALKLAGEEMRFGRGDAQSVIIVITDGYATVRTKAVAAAQEVMKKSRVMWVPVNVLNEAAMDPAEFAEMASDPVQDNVISMADIATLDRTENVDKIITNFCPVIRYETTTGQPTM